MAKAIIIGGVMLVIGAVLYVMYVQEIKPLAALETKTLRAGNAELMVFIADTSEKRTRGLMGVSDLAENTGMLFLFPDTAPRTFWNKNTMLDLDILWIAGGRVVGISRLPSIIRSREIVHMRSPTAVTEVLEVNAGLVKKYNIQIGDNVEVK